MTLDCDGRAVDAELSLLDRRGNALNVNGSRTDTAVTLSCALDAFDSVVARVLTKSEPTEASIVWTIESTCTAGPSTYALGLSYFSSIYGCGYTPGFAFTTPVRGRF